MFCRMIHKNFSNSYIFKVWVSHICCPEIAIANATCQMQSCLSLGFRNVVQESRAGTRIHLDQSQVQNYLVVDLCPLITILLHMKCEMSV